MTALTERRRSVLPSTYKTFYSEPLEVASAEGVWIQDTEGLQYLDAYNNVPVIGHSNPLVRERVAAALSRANTHTRYLAPEIVEYSERLLDHMPAHLDKIVYACTGSEANDLALQVARLWTRRRGVIVTQNAYHGTTEATKAISPSLRGEPGPDDVVEVEVPLTAGGHVDQQLFRARVVRAVDVLEERGHGVAAAVLDSCLTSDGIHCAPAGLLAAVAEPVQARGGLYIADEVQAGFGRTGQWWGFAQYEIRPDLVTLGKPMGNGIPVSALVGRGEILDDYGHRTRYFNTFAGTAVAAAAASTVLDTIESEDLVSRASVLGKRLAGNLRQILDAHGIEAPIRGAGLMIGVDLSTGPDARYVVDAARKNGVLISTTGPANQTLKIRPPLAVNEAEIDEILARLARAFDDPLVTRGGDR